MATSLSGCANPEYPNVSPKLVDWDRQKILNHKITDRKNVKFKSTTWSTDMESLNGNYCFESKEVADMNSWAREMATHCKCE